MMSVIGVIIFMRRKKKLEKLNSEDMELSGEKGTSEKVAETPSPKAASLLPLPSGWEITYSELEIGSELGRGGFNSFNYVLIYPSAGNCLQRKMERNSW